MLVRVVDPHDPGLTVGAPGIQLGQVVHQDADQRQVEVGDPRPAFRLLEPRVGVVGREQVPEGVNRSAVDLVAPGKRAY